MFKRGYWDVLVEYAKQSPDDVLIQISVTNRDERQAELHLVPTLWFRNTWSWPHDGPKPHLRRAPSPPKGAAAVAAEHTGLGHWRLFLAGNPQLLFTEDETNCERCFGTPNASPYVKDGINNCVVHGRHEAVNPEDVGTKAAAHYKFTVDPGRTHVVRLRLAPAEATTDRSAGSSRPR